jgi:hypothetical protein
MKKILLAAMLTLTVLLNGCAVTIPWWLFIKNDPSQRGPAADRLVTERFPKEVPRPTMPLDRSEAAQISELRETSAY